LSRNLPSRKQRNLPSNSGEPIQSIRHSYQQYDVATFYEMFGDRYRNPHEPIIRNLLGLVIQQWALDVSRVLDLACGSGEVTLALQNLGYTDVVGVDPYTQGAYWQRTGQIALGYSFADLAAGAMGDRYFSLIICSFALHLLPASQLPRLLYQLALISPNLLVITPHKRPQINTTWGWELLAETSLARVRARLYTASNSQKGNL